jgi:hypothetical protein
MTLKPGKETEFQDLAKQLTDVTRSEDEGCLNYTFHQQQDNPRKIVLYEQWRDRGALTAHLAHLVELLGPPAEGENLPEAFMENLESMSPVLYDVMS